MQLEPLNRRNRRAARAVESLPADNRQVDGESLAFPDMGDGIRLGGVAPRVLFRHHLPFSNLSVAIVTGDAVTLRVMSTTDSLADPLGGAVAGLLTVPLIQLYAVLWRVGAVEVVATRSESDRRPPAPRAAYLRRHGSRRPPRRSQPRLSPAPAPRRAGPAGYSQAIG